MQTLARYRVAALYRFTRFEDPAAIQGPLAALCCGLGVKGTLLLAREGINGTIAGEDAAIEAVLAHIRALPGCADLAPKTAWAERMPFYRMKVRLKKEIVTLGEPDLDPTDPGTYVAPADWNALISDPDVVVIDTRNDYEGEIGSFERAVQPNTRSFRDFPDWFRTEGRALLDQIRPQRVAMYCTGGIRCEKSTAFLKAEGVENVHHLEGGILRYLEEVEPADSLWRGDCFVFDERVSVGHGLVQGDHTLCRGCRMPLDAEGRASAHFIEGVCCERCRDRRDDAQRLRYAERQRQIELARLRGTEHLGRREDG